MDPRAIYGDRRWGADAREGGGRAQVLAGDDSRAPVRDVVAQPSTPAGGRLSSWLAGPSSEYGAVRARRGVPRAPSAFPLRAVFAVAYRFL